MSTRSYILIEQDDGQYKGIYCHSDGYLEHNGALLMDYFNSREMAEKILELGDLSFLQPNLYPDPEKGPHSFDYNARQELVTVAYGRDRGEKDIEAKIHDLKRLEKDSWGEYFYIFTKDDTWKYFEYGRLSKGFRDLKTDLSAMIKGTELEKAGVFSDYKLEELQAAATPKQATEM